MRIAKRSEVEIDRVEIARGERWATGRPGDRPAPRPRSGRSARGRGILPAAIGGWALWIAVVPLPADEGGRAAPASRPNILLIVAEYMGYADITPYGATDVDTPSIATLAEGGVTFSSFYAASPVCGPSRAALLSGRYPARVGMEANIPAEMSRGVPPGGAQGFGDGLSAEEDTLVRELEEAGYRTAMVGKWHLGKGPGLSPGSHGFDRFFGFHTWTLGCYNHLSADGEPGLHRSEEVVEEEGYLMSLFTEEALDFIGEESAAPFFLYLAYNPGLPPYQPPGLPESAWMDGWDVNKASRADYVAMVEAMDEGIGRILDEVRLLGYEDETIVAFTYDHGGRHLVRSGPLFHGFGTLWEGGIRVPLILRWPAGFEAGVSVDRASIAMDLTATLLEAAGIDAEALALDGTSLLPLLRREGEAEARPLFWRIGAPMAPMRAVRSENWKYVVDGGTQLLFDLGSDIGERDNLFHERPEVVARLRGALAAWERDLDAHRAATAEGSRRTADRLEWPLLSLGLVVALFSLWWLCRRRGTLPAGTARS